MCPVHRCLLLVQIGLGSGVCCCLGLDWRWVQLRPQGLLVASA